MQSFLGRSVESVLDWNVGLANKQAAPRTTNNLYVHFNQESGHEYAADYLKSSWEQKLPLCVCEEEFEEGPEKYGFRHSGSRRMRQPAWIFFNIFTIYTFIL